MTEFIPTEHQHQRYNPLNGKWVLVSPHRMRRPWSGQQESPEKNNLADFEPTNPLCPGVVRNNGEKNPNYKTIFVFPNDFPALLNHVPDPPQIEDPLFALRPAKGECRVMCFHPKSNKTLPKMTINEIEAVIAEWIQQFNELKKKYTWVQIFENKGSAMGCSNPHPHCQIWACSFFPSEPQIKDFYLKKYYESYGAPLLDDYIKRELEKNERIVLLNPDWIVIVPYWAEWPYETMLISRNSNKRIDDLTKPQRKNLACAIKKLTTKYDNLFQCSFPYSMGWHGAPTFDKDEEITSKHWTLHAIYYPPLLRSSSVRKFIVGFELLCQAQRDLTAEQAAQRLRDIDDEIHYEVQK